MRRRIAPGSRAARRASLRPVVRLAPPLTKSLEIKNFQAPGRQLRWFHPTASLRSTSLLRRESPGRQTMATVETPQITETDVRNTVTDKAKKLGVRRYFTIPGRDPFDEIEWEIRDAFIPGKEKAAFDQKSVEFPKFWSQTATNIVAQKYFRGKLGTPERETSVKQMIGRIVDTIGGWGREGGYFATDDEADTFESELKAILVNQLASFNSPVWFNVGFEEKPQCSACFILSID